MGCVKPSYIKNFAMDLMKIYSGDFSTNFDDNKLKVGQYTTIKNKTIRNRVAGYITRVLVQKASRRREVEADV